MGRRVRVKVMARQVLEHNVVQALGALPADERARFGAEVQGALESLQFAPGLENLATATVLADLAQREMARFLPHPGGREEMLAMARCEPLYGLFGCIYLHATLWLQTEACRLN